jgi:hypothetical protein
MAYPFGIFWSWCFLYFFDWQLTPLVSLGHDAVCISAIDGLPLWYLLVMMWSVLLRLTAYPFGIWSTDSIMTKRYQRGKPSIAEVQTTSWPRDTKGVSRQSQKYRQHHAYPFGIFWSWWCLYLFDWRLTPLVSFGHDVVCTSAIDGLPLWYLLVMMHDQEIPKG